MTTNPDDVIYVAGVVKHYNALRPLRLRDWRLARGHAVALHGFDKTAAEVLVNLLTGASLPDEGEVRVFGRATSDIADTSDWLKWLRRFALLTKRTVPWKPADRGAELAIPHIGGRSHPPECARPFARLERNWVFGRLMAPLFKALLLSIWLACALTVLVLRPRFRSPASDSDFHRAMFRSLPGRSPTSWRGPHGGGVSHRRSGVREGCREGSVDAATSHW